MYILKSAMIAFSIYSKIPMPQFEWKEEDMKYMLCFFPWIGGVIGIFVLLWDRIARGLHIGNLTYTLIGMVIPLLVTGGFHVDGFMDTMDAFHSYQDQERKLEILKDSHIGAFAVIMLAAVGLIYGGAFAAITDRKILVIAAAGFFFSRCLSGLSVVCFPSARKEGMLHFFADSAEKQRVKWILVIQALLCAAFMLAKSVRYGGVIVMSGCLTWGYYYYRCKKELGGITGDTAGYFVVISESAMIVAASVLNCLK